MGKSETLIDRKGAYTGFKDKDGNPLFGGDLILYTPEDDEDVDYESEECYIEYDVVKNRWVVFRNIGYRTLRGMKKKCIQKIRGWGRWQG